MQSEAYEHSSSELSTHHFRNNIYAYQNLRKARAVLVAFPRGEKVGMGPNKKDLLHQVSPLYIQPSFR